MFTIPRRFHLFEFCDQPWLKGGLRESYMDYMNCLHTVVKPYKKMYQPLSALGRKYDTILDVASGGSEHIDSILTAAEEKKVTLPRIILSDLFPQTQHYRYMQKKFGINKVGYVATPVPIGEIDKQYPAVMMCTALHHFKPEQIDIFFQDIAANHDCVVVLELNERTPMGIVGSIFGALGMSILANIFSPEFKFERLFYTVTLIVPLMFMWDAVVSALRTHTNDEIEEMFLKACNNNPKHFRITKDSVVYAPFSRAHYFIADRQA